MPAYLSYQIWRVQKRVLRILFPEVKYSKAVEGEGLKKLFQRRVELCSTMFEQIVESDGQHKLAGLLHTQNENERCHFRNRQQRGL